MKNAKWKIHFAIKSNFWGAPQYLAGCFFLFPNWGVSFYFGNLLQLACFLLLLNWGFSLIFKFLLQPACVRYQFYISEHLELLSYNTSYIVLIKQCHIYWFYCVLTLYTIYRKSRLSILFDRQGDPSFGYIFI